ncbi:MAG: LysR family transcriptional regulator [Gammaproteobacteria bacterium]|jgi:DNA-binding transcriptional LysR family regulator|nr:LysR family transcriptional regulator [Gammaproteobacteria bacterium]MBT7483462.1 LysR family transcriptional regulator [Candidatus Peregrinibacteria bacterium]MBT3721945.1 LysR family transcriptional regulator [Gammaproteobacteria bacterium]MBT4075183.1 LysR family transcriptional regulator [Gammaproteobacteria bacterium]MBT4192987.1 LysR family transcriptional regulator [Gammaproteobacteria bacterium]
MSVSPPCYKQNRLKQLRAFCKAVETKSISKAGEELFLSQPTVSLQIRALERELCVQVFERRGPVINLTPDGKILYELSKPLINGIDNLAKNFNNMAGRLESGELHITAGQTACMYLLPKYIHRFKKENPGVHVKLSNNTGKVGRVLLKSDSVDFAVGTEAAESDNMVFEPLFEYEPVLITPLDHPLAGKKNVSLEDISPYDLILPPRELSTWRKVDKIFSDNDVSYKVSMEVGGWEVIKKYVEEGMGISIVSCLCLTGEEKLSATPLTKYFPKQIYGAVIRRGKFLTPQARSFLEILSSNSFDEICPGSTNTQVA